MRYFLGIDIGKYKHVACLLDAEGNVLEKMLPFTADKAGYTDLLAYLRATVGETALDAIHVGMEATGHYWLTLYAQLSADGLGPITVINPLQTKAFRNSNIRGNKTDLIDARKIAQLLRMGDLKPSHIPSADLLALRQLTRLRSDLVELLVVLKQKAIGLLDQLFPEYRHGFSNLFGPTSLAVLLAAPTPAALAAMPTEALAQLLTQASRGRFGPEKAQELQRLAANSFGVTLGSDALGFSLHILVKEIQHMQAQIEALENEIESRGQALGETIHTIPGISLGSAAGILAEIGDFARFLVKDGAEKLVALAGLDPKLSTSGTTRGRTKMSKRGSRYLRKTLRMAAFVAVFQVKDPMFTHIYAKQIARGKHMEVALSHVAHKMIHVIYALMKSKTTYVPVLSSCHGAVITRA
jgi:transposase